MDDIYGFKIYSVRPAQALRLRLPEFLDSRHIKVVRLPALRTGRLYPHVLISVRDPRLIVRPEGLSQQKNPNDPHWKSNPRPSACSVVPQRTQSRHTQDIFSVITTNRNKERWELPSHSRRRYVIRRVRKIPKSLYLDSSQSARLSVRME